MHLPRQTLPCNHHVFILFSDEHWAKAVLKKLFTPGQVLKLKTEGKRVKWSPEDIIQAMTLYRISSKTYKYPKLTSASQVHFKKMGFFSEM